MGTALQISIAIFAVVCGSAVAQQRQCIQGQNCHLPDCFCPTFRHPDFPDIRDIPQMVYFGFDDALTTQLDPYYKTLFSTSHKNPNGCPISMSLYVQDQWTSYGLVKSYYEHGFEIGSHSVTHTNVVTEQQLLFEAGKQKENLTRVGGVPANQVLGWRSPNLMPAGDAQPAVLKKLGYTYDISLTHTRHSNNDLIPWPFTLDYGYPYQCSVPPCPGAATKHAGFWEIPVPSLYNQETGYPCAYVDSCRPSSEAAAFEYLWSNFESVYRNNRAPFGLNMHAAWFMFPDYFKATQTFIQRLLQHNDVYIVTAKQVLDWMGNPVKVSEVSKLREWGCVGAIAPPQQTHTQSPPSVFTPRPPIVLTPPSHVILTRPPPPAQITLFPPVTPPTHEILTRPPPPDFMTRIPPVTPPTHEILTRPPTPDFMTRIPPFTPPPSAILTRPPPGTLNTILSWWQQPVATTTRRPLIATPIPPMSFIPIPSNVQNAQQAGQWRGPPSAKSTGGDQVGIGAGGVQAASPTLFPQPVLINFSGRPITPAPIVSGVNGDQPVRIDTPEPATEAPPPVDRPLFPLPLSAVSPPGNAGAPSTNVCIQEVTCKSPSCICRSLVPPASLSVHRTPQIIYITLSGGIDAVTYPELQNLLSAPSRRNPNGCPISTTFFLPANGNNLQHVQSLRSSGHEIAVQGSSPQFSDGTSQQVEDDLALFATLKSQTAVTGQTAGPSVLGYRNLPSSGTLNRVAMLQTLSSRGVAYDATLVTSRNASLDDVIPWPYTLDFGWQDCKGSSCPEGRYPGLWEVPIVPLVDYKQQFVCSYADACHNHPPTTFDTYNFFMDNLQSHLNSNRAPMGIHLRKEWFMHSYYYPNLRGLEMFLDTVSQSRNDIYVVSIKKMMDWVRSPVPVDQAGRFESWKC